MLRWAIWVGVLVVIIAIHGPAASNPFEATPGQVMLSFLGLGWLVITIVAISKTVIRWLTRSKA